MSKVYAEMRGLKGALFQITCRRVFVTELSFVQIDSPYSCGCRRPLRRRGVRTCPACFVLRGEKQTNWTKTSGGLGWEMKRLDS
jgi:hypothetical protein